MCVGSGGSHTILQAYVEKCWGGMVEMGGTTFWETYSSEWNRELTLPDGGMGAVVWGENGPTSLCHPWASVRALSRTIGLLHVPIQCGWKRIVQANRAVFCADPFSTF